jgi:excisionase family DNA binding protein
MQPLQEQLTIAQTASLLSVSHRTIEEWCRKGVLRSSKIGYKTVRIHRSAVSDLLERNLRQPQWVTGSEALKLLGLR